MTKVAFGVTSLDQLVARWAARRDPFAQDTRYLPKRAEEIARHGSLFWILKHQLVARSAILGFGEGTGGRSSIILAPQLVLVAPRPKRAHQGWRYLEAKDAPRDLAGDGDGGDALPAEMVGRLAELGLL